MHIRNASQAIEGGLNGAAGEPRAIPVGEQERRGTLRDPLDGPNREVGIQYACKLRTHGNQPALLELRIADREDRLRRIHIKQGESGRLAEPQPGPVEHQQQGPERRGVELPGALQGIVDVIRVEEALQLIPAVDMWRCLQGWAPLAFRKRRREGMAAADRVAPEPGQRVVFVFAVPGNGACPGEEGLDLRACDSVASGVAIGVLKELSKQVPRRQELYAVRLAPCHVVFDRISQLHTRPSRSRAATSRRVRRSTLA